MRHLLLSTLSILSLAAPVMAQEAPPAGECTGDSTDPACGAPEQSGGGGGCGCGGGSILIAFTDQGDSYQYADDFDDDGVEDGQDNAPFNFNPDQLDTDGDSIGDAADFCPSVQAPLVAGAPVQRDTDSDGIGDECDEDADNDGEANTDDNCDTVINPGQTDTDGDGDGDACDSNDDNDGCDDASDNCPLQAAANCTDTNAVVPDECFADQDADGVTDSSDNCIAAVNIGQDDADADGIGDACDQDLDNDTVDNRVDNCVQVPNLDQANDDRDSLGNACDGALCYVVDGNESDCLDPTAPFSVFASTQQRPNEAYTTGDGIQLHIFANRENKAIRYQWTVAEQPTDGDAVVVNPTGAVNYSNGIQYVFEADRAPMFTATVPGSYVLELRGELAFDDDEGYSVKSDTSRVTVQVGGETISSCNQGVPAPLYAVSLLGLAALRRRRR